MTTSAKILLGLVAGSGTGVFIYLLYQQMKKKQAVEQDAQSFDFTPALNAIKKFEGFRSTPYWDNKQWTWGYGTAAGFDYNNKPSGTITQAQAEADALAYIKKSYIKISMALSNPISDQLMTALLDFDYNLGFGNTRVVIGNINHGYTPEQTAAEINQYVNSNGVPNSALAERRQYETSLFV